MKKSDVPQDKSNFKDLYYAVDDEGIDAVHLATRQLRRGREYRTTQANNAGAADQLDHFLCIELLQVRRDRCGGFILAIDIDHDTGIGLP